MGSVGREHAWPVGVLTELAYDPSLGHAEVLERMLAALRGVLAARPDAGEAPPRVSYLREDDGSELRVVLANPAALGREDGELSVVGFFGCRRPDCTRDVLEGVDVELIEEFPSHPYILAYLTLTTPDGSCANMVLMDHADGGSRWRESPRHAHAARELAPRAYARVDIHSGVLRGGLGPASRLALLRTRRYDFGAAAATAS